MCLQNLPQGLSTLGVVKKSDKNSLVLYLPHGLTAVATAGDVNPVALEVSRGVSTVPTDEEDDADVPMTPVTGLSSLVSPGQYVSCVVVRAKDKGDAHAVRVSLDPALVNNGLTAHHLSKDLSSVWGYIQSKEDHGFVVQLGIPGVAAFLPFKHVVGGPSSLQPGMPAFFRIWSSKPTASSVVLSYDPSSKPHFLTSVGTLDLPSVKPGMLVTGSIKKVCHLCTQSFFGC